MMMLRFRADELFDIKCRNALCGNNIIKSFTISFFHFMVNKGMHLNNKFVVTQYFNFVALVKSN
jgi:hypothetical protein